MANFRYEPDPQGMAQLAKLQQELTDKAQAAVREVNETMQGRPVPEILDELRGRIRALGAEPDDAALSQLAEKISAVSAPLEENNDE